MACTQAERKAQQKRGLQQQPGSTGNDSGDGDVDMAPAKFRKKRGGAREARRKRRRQGLGDVDMQPAEAEVLNISQAC